MNVSSERTAPVAVVVPTYNYARFLPELIASVLGQSLAPAEVIVVDDGSTDDTQEVLGRYPQLRAMRQENAGPAAARNRGWRAANQEFILFVDADDRLLPDAIQQLYQAGRRVAECAAVFAQAEILREDDRSPADQPVPRFPDRAEIDPLAARWLDEQTAIMGPGLVDRLLLNNVMLQGCTMVRREVLCRCGGYDARFASAEDQHLWLRVASTQPVAFLARCVAAYRKHAAGLTNPGRWIENRRNILAVLADVMDGGWASPELRAAASRRFVSTSDHLAGRLMDAKRWREASAALRQARRRGRLSAKSWVRLAFCVARGPGQADADGQATRADTHEREGT